MKLKFPNKTSLFTMLSVAAPWLTTAPPVGVVTWRLTVVLMADPTFTRIGTPKVRLVCPSAKASVPLTGVKSTPAIAVPSPVVA